MLIGASEGGALLARAERDIAVFDAVAAEAVAAVEAAVRGVRSNRDDVRRPCPVLP